MAGYYSKSFHGIFYLYLTPTIYMPTSSQGRGWSEYGKSRWLPEKRTDGPWVGYSGGRMDLLRVINCFTITHSQRDVDC